jgi:feruloyl esterase
MNKTIVFGIFLYIVNAWAPGASAASCESLASLKLPDTTITLAQTVQAGSFAPAAGPRGGGGGNVPNPFRAMPTFCRVAATLKPSPDSDIKIEVWLPESGWNSKFQAVGNGGWTGSIPYPALAAGVQRGYATAGTDTGHEGGSGSFALGHPEKLTDFAYRAVHEMTVKAKSIIDAYYGNNPKYSYWNGCSSGGKQGLKEAQRFPNDFDGIIAGAPAAYWTHLTASAAWVGQAVNRTESSYIPPAKYGPIHNAAINACDANDSVKDGVIDDPKKCKFDPKVLQCRDGDGPDCLTAGQVETARAMYSPVVNPRTKETLFPGFEPGSEMGWSIVAGPRPTSLGIDHWKYVVFKDPNWDYKTMDFDKDVALGDKLDNGAINAIDPNLAPFFSRGGKLLQYHGWADPLIPPQSSVDYYNSVLKTMGGAAKVNDSYRLFMVGGMGHCAGGDGPANFDMLSALEQWVEKGSAPASIPAAHVSNGKPDRTRILCPYPQVASYKGSGDPNDAANFVCK